MNLRTRVLRSSVARLGATFASLGISFFMMPFIVRALGDHSYGLWVIVAGIETYYYLLDFGLSVAASRYITVQVASENDEGVNEAVSTAFAVFTVLGVLVAVMTLVAAGIAGRFAQPQDVWTVRTLILLTGFGAAVGFPVKAYGGIVFSHLRHDLIEISNIVRRVIESVIVYWALSTGHGVVTYAVILVTSNQVGSVYFYWLANRLWPKLRVSRKYFRKDLTREMFRYSFWSLVSQVGDMLRFKIDALVVGRYSGASTVTHFNVGSRLGELTFGLIYRATNFMAPLYTRYHAQGEIGEIQEKLVVFTRINTFLACCGGGVLILIGEPFIRHWMGSAYQDAYPVLVALLLGQMVEAMSAPASNVLYGVAKHKVFGLATIAEAAVKLILSIILIQRMGMVGVAWGTTIPLVINKLIVIPLYTCHVTGLSPGRYYRNIAPTLVVTLTVVGMSYAILHKQLDQVGYLGLILASLVPVATLTALSYFFGLSKNERQAFAALMSTSYARLRGREAAAPTGSS